MQRTYDIGEFKDSTEFLEVLARKGGRLLKGGEADLNGVAKMVLNDFLRGKLPWFTPPPAAAVVAGSEVKAEGERKDRLADVVRLNQQPTADLRAMKRKRDDEDVEGVADVVGEEGLLDDEEEDDEDDFEGLSDNDEAAEEGDDDDDAEAGLELGGSDSDGGTLVDGEAEAVENVIKI